MDHAQQRKEHNIIILMKFYKPASAHTQFTGFDGWMAWQINLQIAQHLNSIRGFAYLAPCMQVLHEFKGLISLSCPHILGGSCCVVQLLDVLRPLVGQPVMGEIVCLFAVFRAAHTGVSPRWVLVQFLKVALLKFNWALQHKRCCQNYILKAMCTSCMWNQNAEQNILYNGIEWEKTNNSSTHLHWSPTITCNFLVLQCCPMIGSPEEFHTTPLATANTMFRLTLLSQAIKFTSS